jgi:uncharacterized protein
MKEFIEYLAKQIVNNPEEVEVTEEKNGGNYLFTLKVAQEDMGITIGREGRTIKSIREMVKTKAIKDNVRVDLKLHDDTRNDNQNDYA